MNKVKRMMAMVLAMAAMSATIGSIAASAEELSSETVDNAVLEAYYAELVSLIDATETNTFAAYDSYAQDKISVTPHYLVGLGNKISNINYTFYLTSNALTDCTNVSNFFFGSDFTGITATFDTTGVIDNSVNVIKMRPNKSKTNSNKSAVIGCKVYPNKEIVTSEKWLHYYTSSPASGYNDVNITASNSSYNLVKCIYSLGDVDRNGQVNATDSMNILRYISGLFEADTNRKTQAEYDKLAFELAADVNHDGQVTEEDVQLLNQFLLLGTPLT